jgi:hypothetical protein
MPMLICCLQQIIIKRLLCSINSFLEVLCIDFIFF